MVREYSTLRVHEVYRRTKACMNSQLAVSTVSGKQWLLASICLGVKATEIDTASGLMHGLCKAFSMQGIKRCTADQRLCINTSDNDTVLYIGPSFNYTKAFSLLLLTVVTCTGLQEALRTVWSLSPFGVPCQQPEGFLWQVMKVLPSGTPLIHITVVIYHHYFYKNEKKVHHNTFKTSTHSLFWIQWRQTTKVWLLKGGVLGVFQSLISQRESLPELWTSETYCM